MSSKSDSIIQELEKYKSQVLKYIKESIDYQKTLEDNPSIYPPRKIDSAESFISLIRYTIYPYINNEEILHKEFFARAKYYQCLNAREVFKKILDELHNDINKLYALVDINEAISIEEDDNQYFFSSCNKAIESLNIKMESEEEGYYHKLIKLIKDKNNYYTLDFAQGCSYDFYEETDLAITDSDRILNINKIIAQYKAIEEPISNDFINNKVQYLIPDINIDEFAKIKTNYKDNVEKLVELLKKDFESKNLLSFYLFDKFMDCGNRCKNFSDVDSFFKCLNCYISVFFVVSELSNFVADQNAQPAKIIGTDEFSTLISMLNDFSNVNKQSKAIDLKLLLTQEEFNAVKATNEHKDQKSAAEALCKDYTTILKQLESARIKVKKHLDVKKLSTNELCKMIDQ